MSRRPLRRWAPLAGTCQDQGRPSSGTDAGEGGWQRGQQMLRLGRGLSTCSCRGAGEDRRLSSGHRKCPRFYIPIVHMLSVYSLHFMLYPKLNCSNDLGPQPAVTQIRASLPKEPCSSDTWSTPSRPPFYLQKREKGASRVRLLGPQALPFKGA